ncbi:TRAP transporter small permease [Cohaesibacter haloalkalitolerans]|uniref:TRAP transporter small permease n=1 Tax=Cohaesibacter haloalkalitolerans TaxID=1162980 RepID=UPI000E6557B8|nr:TRAP transporter small permease [Cohaesibacter haloalkalitolerans]
MQDTHTSGPASAGPVFDLIASLTKWITGFVLVALVCLVFSETLLRGLANISLGFVEEVTGYFVVTLTFLGAALALRSETLFQVHFLFDAVPDGAQVWMKRFFVIVSLIVCAILAIKTQDLVLSSLTRGKFAPTVLHTPLWIPQTIMPFGFSLIGIFLFEKLLLGRRKKEERN